MSTETEMTPEEKLAELIRVLNDIYLSRLFSGVALTWTLYDWLLVFRNEFETIYQSRWTLAKALFFYIRVITPMGIMFCIYELSDLRGPLSAQFCTVWAFIQTLGMLTSLIAANALLTLRLVALYRRKTFMVWFIRGFFVLSYVATIALMTDGMATFKGAMSYSNEAKVCASTMPSQTFKAIFYAPAAFEFFVFALTSWRAWNDAKVITGADSAPFLLILYRDGIISFFVMIGVRIWNIYIYLHQPLSSYTMGTQIMWATNTVLTTRVYMNLVWLAKKPMIEDTSMGTRNPTQAIRMRVTTFTQVKTDDWKSRQGESPYGVGDDRDY